MNGDTEFHSQNILHKLWMALKNPVLVIEREPFRIRYNFQLILGLAILLSMGAGAAVYLIELDRFRNRQSFHQFVDGNARYVERHDRRDRYGLLPIKSLWMSGIKLQQFSKGGLGQETQIIELWLYSCNKIPVDEISKLEELEYLVLSEADISNEDLKKLAKLPSLKSVTFRQCLGFDEIGVSYLASQQNVRHIKLTNDLSLSEIRHHDQCEIELPDRQLQSFTGEY